MENQLNYYKISRAEWKEFYKEHIVPLTKGELARIMSLNDRISQADVSEIYMPLVHLIGLRWKIQQQKLKQQAEFLGKKKPQKVPLVIGIAGSVAVGKSTTARLLQTLLKEIYPHKKVQLITTDGFLYSTAELKRRHILSKKGFPESYDMDRLLRFMDDVKNNLPRPQSIHIKSMTLLVVSTSWLKTSISWLWKGLTSCSYQVTSSCMSVTTSIFQSTSTLRKS